MSFNQVWSCSAIAPAASLFIWWWYRTFNGSALRFPMGVILDMQDAFKVNYFAADKG